MNVHYSSFYGLLNTSYIDCMKSYELLMSLFAIDHHAVAKPLW